MIRYDNTYNWLTLLFGKLCSLRSPKKLIILSLGMYHLIVRYHWDSLPKAISTIDLSQCLQLVLLVIELLGSNYFLLNYQYSILIQSNLSDLNIKDIVFFQLFNLKLFEGSNECTEIQNIEVFKGRSKCTINHRASSSCDNLPCRSMPLNIQRLWIKNLKIVQVRVSSLKIVEVISLEIFYL